MNYTLEELERATRELKVLYVEDNAEARQSTLMVLNEFFHEVVTALDGKEGLQKSLNEHFDLILTDINMPVMNGIEMLLAMRKAGSTTPAVILSAYNEQHYFIESIRAGVEGYLLKPIEVDQFIDIIGRVTEKIRLIDENRAYNQRLEEMVAEQTKEIKSKAQRLYQQSVTDSVTGLYNASMLSQLVERSHYNYLLVLDIVNFSIINKQYGKKFGNAVIHATAQMLQRQMTEQMRLFKVESDRFVIAVKDVECKGLEQIARQLIAFFDATNLNVEGSEININFTIGATEVVKDNNTLLQADFAIDWAKQMGRRSYYLYEENSESMLREQETIKWLNRTRELISEDKIEPYFQPIKSVSEGKIVKYEVLARGIDNEEIIPPGYFLSAAERLGLTSSITRTIVNKSFAFFANNGYTYDFSINIGERDLGDEGFSEFMTKKAKHYGIDPSRVTCEILEGITMSQNSAQIMQELKKLREAGFKLAVDDFGVENSNFSRLLDIDLDFIKIDGVFVRNITKNEKDRKIVCAIVKLAKTLGIETIAEFVEDEAVYNEVIKCGIGYVQGYYIGKPSALIIEG